MIWPFTLIRKKPPPERPRQPYIPGYSYLQYKADLFDRSLTVDDIFDRCDGKIPKKPRYPKPGEVWEFRSCRQHGTSDLMYPSDLRFNPDVNYWPFVHCGCLYFLHEGKQ